MLKSNQIYALFIVSLVFTLLNIYAVMQMQEPPLTGKASGVANVSISELASVTMSPSRDITNFGDGQPNIGSSLNISTESINFNGFNNGSYGNGTNFGLDVEGEGFAFAMVVVNDGNRDIKVEIASNASASEFIGGSMQTPHVFYYGINNESGSCSSGLQSTPNELNITNQDLCSVLDENGISDSIQVHYILTIPEDALGGKLAEITFSAS